MEGKGISPIIATVFLILLTLALAGMLWTTIVPNIRDKLEEESVCKDAAGQIEILNDGLTCADFNVTNKSDIISVHVRRGPKEIRLVDMIFTFESKGNSWSLSYVNHIEPGLKMEKLPAPGIPLPNEEKQYYVAGKIIREKITFDAVSISPVIAVSPSKFVQCPGTPFVKLTPCLARE